MSLGVVLDAAGGLALFLLAMSMMTEGLTAFAGGGLKRLLERWTSTPLRGVVAGVLITGLVQSSSAVTVATIGFVNAGILTLRQALGVIFGTNVGTTVTGWLVSLVGVGFKIEAIALPILTLGVVLRLAAPGKRLGDPETREALLAAIAAAATCAGLTERPTQRPGDDALQREALGVMARAYERAKGALLAAAVGRSEALPGLGQALDDLSATRRLVEQLVQADRLLLFAVAGGAAGDEEADQDRSGLPVA